MHEQQAHLKGVRAPRPQVVIAGGGVAAIEALLALRHLVGEQVAIALLAPEPRFVHRPSSVAEPFGLGGPASLDLEALARDQGAELVARHAARRRSRTPRRRARRWPGARVRRARRRRRRGLESGRAGRHQLRRPAPGGRGCRRPRRRRTRRAPPPRLRRPGRDDVVAAGLRARHDGRGRPARPWGRERHARHRYRRGRAARPVRGRRRRRVARDARRAPHLAVDTAAGRSSRATACSSSTPARRCAPTR